MKRIHNVHTVKGAKRFLTRRAWQIAEKRVSIPSTKRDKLILACRNTALKTLKEEKNRIGITTR